MFATKDNPAADARQMRRIIAEDPDWLVNDFVVIMFFFSAKVIFNLRVRFFSFSIGCILDHTNRVSPFYTHQATGDFCHL